MSDGWPAPDYWCTICDRGAEGCMHTPADVPESNAYPKGRNDAEAR